MMRGARATLAGLVPLKGVFPALGADLRDLRLHGPVARQATVTMFAVLIASLVAMAAHLNMPWWAALSAFMSVQATHPDSLQRASLRVLGTATGAASALLFTPWTIQDPVAGSLFVLAATTVGTLGFLVDRYGYAWLFFGITANLVTLMSVADPTRALHFAFYRVAEVFIGCLVALLTVLVLARDAPARPRPTTPGWSDLLGARWPAVQHALQSGIAIMLLPWIWAWFDLPGLAQMAVTVGAVMGVPVLDPSPGDRGRRVAGRAAQRVLGCFLGGLVGVGVLTCSIAALAPWMIVLGAVTWVGASMQASTRGVGYVGTQATVVFIVMIAQDWGPPTTIQPGIERLVGMIGGVTVLLIVALLIWPDAAPEPAPSPSR